MEIKLITSTKQIIIIPCSIPDFKVKMNDLFKYVVCISNKPVKMACLTEQCHLSPFVCSENCVCYWQHKLTCSIKTLQELNQNMLKVLQFQFLVMYSPVLRGGSISVMGRYAEQTLSRIKNQQFALTFDPISRENAENEISIRLKRIKSCVGVGVFIRETLVRNNFKYLPDEKYLNHGGYMLLSNNYLFSSSFDDQNCIESKKMNLKQGDIIHVRIVSDQKEPKIEFTQQGSRRKEMLKFDWKIEFTYHFGVYLYDEGDSAQIINKRI